MTVGHICDVYFVSVVTCMIFMFMFSWCAKSLHHNTVCFLDFNLFIEYICNTFCQFMLSVIYLCTQFRSYYNFFSATVVCGFTKVTARTVFDTAVQWMCCGICVQCGDCYDDVVVAGVHRPFKRPKHHRMSFSQSGYTFTPLVHKKRTATSIVHYY